MPESKRIWQATLKATRLIFLGGVQGAASPLRILMLLLLPLLVQLLLLLSAKLG